MERRGELYVFDIHDFLFVWILAFVQVRSTWGEELIVGGDCPLTPR